MDRVDGERAYSGIAWAKARAKVDEKVIVRRCQEMNEALLASLVNCSALESLIQREVEDRMQKERSLVGRPLSEVLRYYVGKALELCHQNRREAAKMLSIGQRTLYRWIKPDRQDHFNLAATLFPPVRWTVNDEVEGAGQSGGNVNGQ